MAITKQQKKAKQLKGVFLSLLLEALRACLSGYVTGIGFEAKISR